MRQVIRKLEKPTIIKDNCGNCWLGNESLGRLPSMEQKDNLGLFHLINIDVSYYMSGTGFTLVKNNPDSVLELRELLLKNWSEEPAHLIKSAKTPVRNAQIAVDTLVSYILGWGR